MHNRVVAKPFFLALQSAMGLKSSFKGMFFAYPNHPPHRNYPFRIRSIEASLKHKLATHVARQKNKFKLSNLKTRYLLNEYLIRTKSIKFNQEKQPQLTKTPKLHRTKMKISQSLWSSILSQTIWLFTETMLRMDHKLSKNHLLANISLKIREILASKNLKDEFSDGRWFSF